MSVVTFFIFSISIIFAAIIGVIRFKKMDPNYHPFIYYACLSLLVEIIVFILLSYNKKYIVPSVYNAFALTEFYLFTLMFHNLGIFKRKRKVFIALIASSFLLFLCTLYIRGYDKSNYFSQVVNSFVLIFVSISAFNKMILNERSNIFKNAKFWICIGMVIYYTYFILVTTEKISFIDLKTSKYFNNKIWQINAYANLLVNLLYAVAVLCIPKKKNIITLL